MITFDGDGRQVWKRQPGTERADYGSGVATGADGGVYVAGVTGGSLGGPNKGNGDAFVIKFDRDGRRIWDRQPGSGRSEWLSGVATDTFGDITIAGYAFHSIVKFDADGNQIGQGQSGSNVTDIVQGLAIDASGNAYVVGYTNGSSGGPNQGSYDAFLIKYAAGTLQ